MDELEERTRQLLDLGLWESAEILARLLASPTSSILKQAANEALLGDALFGKAELAVAEKHYREALSCYKLATISQEVAGEAESIAQVSCKLAQCIASRLPREALQVLESVPAPNRTPAIWALLGKVYLRCSYKEAALRSYKACLRGCPCAAEAALAVADLTGSTEEVRELLTLPVPQVEKSTPLRSDLKGLAHLLSTPSDGFPFTKDSLEVWEQSPAKSAASHPKPGRSAAEKRLRIGSESPERKRLALEDRAALDNAEQHQHTSHNSSQTAFYSPRNSVCVPADENRKEMQGQAAGKNSFQLDPATPSAGKQASSVSPLGVLGGMSALQWIEQLAHGRALESCQNAKAAVQCYAQLINQCPNNVHLMLSLARAQDAAGNPYAAIELYERCRSLEPQSTNGMADFAMLLFREGRGMQLGKLASALAPNGVDLGMEAHSESHRPERWMAASCDFWVAASAYFALRGATGSLEALIRIKQAKELGVKHAALPFLKGHLLAKEERTAVDAIAAFQESYRLSPHWRTMLECAKAALKVNKRMEALAFAKEASKTRDAEALVLLASVYWDNSEKQKEAMECVDAALAQNPDHIAAISMKATFLCQKRQPREAYDLLSPKAEKLPNDKLHYHLGKALQQMGNVMEAVLHFQHALCLNPNNDLAKQELESCDAELKEKQRARLRLGELSKGGNLNPAPKDAPPIDSSPLDAVRGRMENLVSRWAALQEGGSAADRAMDLGSWQTYGNMAQAARTAGRASVAGQQPMTTSAAEQVASLLAPSTREATNRIQHSTDGPRSSQSLMAPGNLQPRSELDYLLTAHLGSSQPPGVQMQSDDEVSVVLTDHGPTNSDNSYS